jgi:hypothetical protein
VNLIRRRDSTIAIRSLHVDSTSSRRLGVISQLVRRRLGVISQLVRRRLGVISQWAQSGLGVRIFLRVRWITRLFPQRFHARLDPMRTANT